METNSVGLYEWTDSNGNIRPTAGSKEAERRHKAWLKYRAEALNTPEGQAWLDKHGFTKTNMEDLDWLTENGLI